MAIQIIDNFNLSVAKPIDDRFVVGSQSFYTNRNNIPYKYTGLRIWDLNDGVPYVWNGTTWASENSISVSGSGNVNYVPKFIGSGISNTIGESCIYISGASVGVNTGSSITTGYNLDVNGGIISQGLTGFSGRGTLLTSLNANNITIGTMSLANLANNNTSGWILTSGSLQPIYTNPYLITVGAASASIVVNAAADTTVYHLGFFNAGSISGSGTYQSRVSVVTSSEDETRKQLTYKPSSGNLTSALITTGTFSVGLGAASSPSIRFNGFSSTGIYSTGYTLGFSLIASTKLFIDSSGVIFGTSSNFYPRVISSLTSTAGAPSYTWYGDIDTGMYRSAANTIGFSTNGVERMSLTIDGIKHINSTFTTGPTFSLGIGTLAQTTMATFSSVSYDRVIYMHSSNNSNATYINSPGWVEITAYIGGQQIYSSFFGADSDIRPSFSFSCILPANSLLYIKLQKSTLSYGAGQSAPTIYTTSLKFGL